MLPPIILDAVRKRHEFCNLEFTCLTDNLIGIQTGKLLAKKDSRLLKGAAKSNSLRVYKAAKKSSRQETCI